MARAKKEFKTSLDNHSRLQASPESALTLPKEIVIEFPKTIIIPNRSFDFAPYYCQGFDDITTHCQYIIQQMRDECITTKETKLSLITVINYSHKLRYFFSFCSLVAGTLDRGLLLDDINKLFVKGFIRYLSETSLSQVSQKDIYTEIKSILLAMTKHGWIANDIFPRNPYPNTNRSLKGAKALSKTERKPLIQALRKSLKAISDKSESLSAYELTICIIAIAVRTGLNPTPLLNLTVDCLQPHPIKYNRRLLVSYKRRGNNIRVQPLRESQASENLNTVTMDVVDIIEMVIQRNKMPRALSDSDYLWFHFSKNNKKSLRLTQSLLTQHIKSFVTNNSLLSDEGNSLVLNVMRLRKTFENQIFELSGQDPFVTASMGGHTMKVSNDFYLDAPKEAENNFRMMGEIRNKELLENNNVIPLKPIENTPVARCKDPKYGHLAPKNGEYCDRFLSCVRCKSFVVTSDDLYRLFSFYWMLVRERDRGSMRLKDWSRHYAHIIRIIDSQIAPHFDEDEVKAAKEKARLKSHPFWADPEILEEI